MKVYFSDRAFAAVLAETTEKITTETGGLFLGKVKDDSWYIVEAIDPGPNSVFEVAYFEYDRDYTQHLINKIANLYEEKLELIGLWHRHPGSFDQFSSTDDLTNSKYALMRSEGAISGLINIDPDFRFTMYHVGQPCRYRRISYDVGDSLIPGELLRYKTPDRFRSLMQSRMKAGRRRGRAQADYSVSVSLESFMEHILTCIDTECDAPVIENDLTDEELTVKLTDAIIDDLTFMADKVGIKAAAAIKGQFLIITQETVSKTTVLYFTYDRENDRVIMAYNDKCYVYTSGMFEAASRKAAEKKSAEKQTDAESSGDNTGSEKDDKERNGIFRSVRRIIPFRKDDK